MEENLKQEVVRVDADREFGLEKPEEKSTSCEQAGLVTVVYNPRGIDHELGPKPNSDEQAGSQPSGAHPCSEALGSMHLV